MFTSSNTPMFSMNRKQCQAGPKVIEIILGKNLMQSPTNSMKHVTNIYIQVS
jgi:hypothetical protein